MCSSCCTWGSRTYLSVPPPLQHQQMAPGCCTKLPFTSALISCPQVVFLPSSLYVSLLFEGIIWFLLPTALVIVNDIMAYLAGKCL